MTSIPDVDLQSLPRLASLLTQHLIRPVTVGLVGTLGAGKTTLVQEITRAVGVDVADVTSPTFTLLQTYEGQFRVHHLDAYRVADEDEFLELGVEELFDEEDSFTVIEWADRVSSVLPSDSVWIQVDVQSPTTRTVHLKSDERRGQIDLVSAEMLDPQR